MTLRRRLILGLAAFALAGAVPAGVAIWQIAQLRDNLAIAADAQASLRRVYRTGAHLAVARSTSDATQRRAALERAVVTLDESRPEFAATEPASPVDDAFRQAMLASRTTGDVNPALASAARVDVEQGVRLRAAQRAADANRRTAMIAIGATTLATLTVAGVGAVLLYRRVDGPLSHVRSAVRAVASGDHGARAIETGDAEFASLAADFNRMAERIDMLCRTLEAELVRTRDSLVSADRLAQVGLVAASAAHEIASPLTAMACTSERALRNATNPAEARKALTMLRDDALHCQSIARSMLDVVRPERSSQGESAAMLRDAVEWARHRAALLYARTEPIDWSIALPCDVKLAIAPAELRQVLFNLFSNAARAVPPRSGRIDISATTTSEAVELVIRDNGPGVDPSIRKTLFEPLGSPDAAGHGLGLYVCRQLLAVRGGSIRLDDRAAATTFVVTLLVAAEGCHA
jgi:signal transduction histidine kinase